MHVYMFVKQKLKLKPCHTKQRQKADLPANGRIYGPAKYRNLEFWGVVFLSVSINCQCLKPGAYTGKKKQIS